MSVNLTESPEQALARIQSMGFSKNDGRVIMAFVDADVPPTDIEPRVNVLTFKAWKAKGRQVAKGAMSVRVTVWIKKDSKGTEDGKRKMFPKTTSLFHASQTIGKDDAKGTKPVAWQNPKLVKPDTYNDDNDAPTPWTDTTTIQQVDAEMTAVLTNQPVNVAEFSGPTIGDIKPSKADKLREMAQRWDDAANESLGRDRQTNTNKRLGQARSAERDAQQLKRAAQLTRAYADNLESGTLPDALKDFKPIKANFIAAAAKVSVHVQNCYHAYSVDGQEYRDMSTQAVALRALHVKSDDDKEADLENARKADIDRAIDELRNAKIDGFFPTPKDIINQMIDAADIETGHKILEPSAGIGSIVDELPNGSDITCCELRPSLCNILSMKGYGVVSGDFIERFSMTTEAEQFDRVIMNPPFERKLAAQHINHAFKLLKPGGRIVALIPPNHVDGIEFDFDTVNVESGSFNTATAFRKTGVNVCMIVADKPSVCVSIVSEEILELNEDGELETVLSEWC